MYSDPHGPKALWSASSVTVPSYGAIQNLIWSFISEEQRQVTHALASAGEFEKSEEGKWKKVQSKGLALAVPESCFI